jgi:hypothetical protein
MFSALATIVCFSAVNAKEKMREICWQNGYLLWADTRESITRGAAGYLSEEQKASAYYCSCGDLRRACITGGEKDCDKMAIECTESLKSGGTFCKANQWGGQNCYK